MVRAKVYGLIGVLMGLLGGIQARAEATLAYYHTDHLGSVRMITDSQGAVISVHDYFPYGEDTTPTPSNRLKFTGQLRDHESGLDYFGARYYASTLSRFMSPDDFRNDSDPSHPQSWNLYAIGCGISKSTTRSAKTERASRRGSRRRELRAGLLHSVWSDDLSSWAKLPDSRWRWEKHQLRAERNTRNRRGPAVRGAWRQIGCA
ncbi:MAG: RHS repeat-associated core domain-containing protein [Acidobacteria bacterium]|nr:RHS repeat-associated core domain-containing protein [Acidobacteriota bacterium]MBI3656913.1 RHS repeat-associated core domain-containing protein [Acidobacteriota bacterium]